MLDYLREIIEILNDGKQIGTKRNKNQLFEDIESYLDNHGDTNFYFVFDDYDAFDQDKKRYFKDILKFLMDMMISHNLKIIGTSHRLTKEKLSYRNFQKMKIKYEVVTFPYYYNYYTEKENDKDVLECFRYTDDDLTEIAFSRMEDESIDNIFDKNAIKELALACRIRNFPISRYFDLIEKSFRRNVQKILDDQKIKKEDVVPIIESVGKGLSVENIGLHEQIILMGICKIIKRKFSEENLNTNNLKCNISARTIFTEYKKALKGTIMKGNHLSFTAFSKRCNELQRYGFFEMQNRPAKLRKVCFFVLELEKQLVEITSSRMNLLFEKK